MNRNMNRNMYRDTNRDTEMLDVSELQIQAREAAKQAPSRLSIWASKAMANIFTLGAIAGGSMAALGALHFIGNFALWAGAVAALSVIGPMGAVACFGGAMASALMVKFCMRRAAAKTEEYNKAQVVILQAANETQSQEAVSAYAQTVAQNFKAGQSLSPEQVSMLALAEDKDWAGLPLAEQAELLRAQRDIARHLLTRAKVRTTPELMAGDEVLAAGATPAAQILQLRAQRDGLHQLLEKNDRTKTALQDLRAQIAEDDAGRSAYKYRRDYYDYSPNYYPAPNFFYFGGGDSGGGGFKMDKDSGKALVAIVVAIIATAPIWWSLYERFGSTKVPTLAKAAESQITTINTATALETLVAAQQAFPRQEIVASNTVVPTTIADIRAEAALAAERGEAAATIATAAPAAGVARVRLANDAGKAPVRPREFKVRGISMPEVA